jgi:hypothetical protein
MSLKANACSGGGLAARLSPLTALQNTVTATKILNKSELGGRDMDGRAVN